MWLNFTHWLKINSFQENLTPCSVTFRGGGGTEARVQPCFRWAVATARNMDTRRPRRAPGRTGKVVPKNKKTQSDGVWGAAGRGSLLSEREGSKGCSETNGQRTSGARAVSAAAPARSALLSHKPQTGLLCGARLWFTHTHISDQLFIPFKFSDLEFTKTRSQSLH